MNGFVLSGGANLGSIQAGMIEALIDAGVVPDVLVGTSIGAANAAFLAADPSPQRARALSDLWRRVRARDIFPLNPVGVARALFREAALFPVRPWRRLLEREIPFERIEEAAVPLRIIATGFEDGATVVFDAGSVVDAVLASTALPGVFPPHCIGDVHYLDGGLSDLVPLTPAIEAGANTIYILSVGFPCPPPAQHRSARAVLMHSIGLLLSQRIRLDALDLPTHHPSVKLIQIPPVCTQVGLRDFSRSGMLIERARDQTARFLAGEDCPGCQHQKTSDARISAELTVEITKT